MEVMYLMKSDKNGNKVLIGELAKTGDEYTFKYTPEKIDKPEGFFKVPTFKDVDRVYTSDKLFLFFANRLYDRGRPDLPQLLERHGLRDYDEWELLKATKARLMTDSYELSLSPISSIEMGLDVKMSILPIPYLTPNRCLHIDTDYFSYERPNCTVQVFYSQVRNARNATWGGGESLFIEFNNAINKFNGLYIDPQHPKMLELHTKLEGLNLIQKLHST